MRKDGKKRKRKSSTTRIWESYLLQKKVDVNYSMRKYRIIKKCRLYYGNIFNYN